ncbi:single-stranded DNA-binding protein [Planobacterium oryzisoli]|uniref:Single-stranded DNA-binding protein n=1 Tax=Planobacterium oryzisoli TaxID=2771435 RepID=A0A930YTX2_9FLAO|nr:single-stranded DNA-binding protein [Planobacterium oryzisoli]MBF5026293.1 single-stranded DNA-binding protein [Planobacterium oryzisoli]
MAMRNSVSLIGRAGSKAEIITFEKGGTKASVALATHDYYINALGDRVDETQWHNLVAFGRNANYMQTAVNKGSQMAVEGKLIHRSYETASGEIRYVTEIRVNDVVVFDVEHDDQKQNAKVAQ